MSEFYMEIAIKDYPLKVLDPNKALTRPGGMVSLTLEIELGSIEKVTVEVDSTRQISGSREDNNILSTILTPKMGISIEPKATKPSEVVIKGEPLIKIVRVYQEGGKIYIVLKNERHGKFFPRDYNQGKIAVRYGDKTSLFLLKNIDPERHLDRFGGEVKFNTNIQIEGKPKGASLPINITFYDLKDIKVGSMEMVVPPSPPLEVAKPILHGLRYKLPALITPALINKGGRFVGGIDYKISAKGSDNLKEHCQKIFTEQDPFDHGELVPIPPTFCIDWQKFCYLHLFCKVKSQQIPESDETNNTAVITIYPPPSRARFELMNEKINLRSGTALWTPSNGDTVKMTDKVTVTKPDVVLMDIDFIVFNCSGETRTLNPLISYLGPGGQKIEQYIGPVQIRPGDHMPFRTTIQLGIRFGNYNRDNFIRLNLWDKKSFNVKIDFTTYETFRAMLGGRCLGLICYPERVILGFNRGEKFLTNGGSVRLEKGDWVWGNRDEFSLELLVTVWLKASARYRTKLTFKLASFGHEFTINKEVEFETPGREIGLINNMKMWQSPRGGTLMIIDEQTGNEIFRGNIEFSESLLKEVGWRPWLHLSQPPNIYLKNQKKQVTIICYVFNAGGPVNNQTWWLNLEIQYRNQVVQRKTWQFDGAPSSKLIEKKFTFKPFRDGLYIYKITLNSKNKNILGNQQDDLKRVGSFDVPSSWRKGTVFFK